MLAKKMMLATLLLPVVSLMVQSYQHEQLCSCGSTSNNDFPALECAQWDEGGLTQEMLNSIYYTSQEACSGFTEFGIDSCKMNTSYTPQDYCSTTNDGTQVCFIQSPNYSTNQCYTPMTFCAHSVTCPLGSVLYYHNSFLDMTANFPFVYATDYSQCTDSLEVEADYQYYTRCGAATVPTFVSSFGSLLVQFASSKSCQSNGYSMWAICVPLPLSYQLRKQYQNRVNSFGTKKRSLSLRASPDTIIEKYPPIVQEVNFSLTLHYNDSTIRIKEHNTVIRTFPAIPVFHLYDSNGESVKTFKKENPSKMNGYGVLKVVGRIAHYIEVGIPKELIPSEKEKRLINRLLDFLVPYHVKSKPYDGPNTKNEASVNGDSNPSCIDESSCLSCDSAQSKSAEDKIFKEAVLCRKENGNPFVQSVVNLAIETIAKKKYCA